MNTNTVKNAIKLLRSVADELEMSLPLSEVDWENQCIACDFWDCGLKQCGRYKQVPPEHVMKDPLKHCRDCTIIPF